MNYSHLIVNGANLSIYEHATHFVPNIRHKAIFQVIFQVYLRWFLTFWTHEHMKVPKPSLVQIGLQLFKWGHLHIFSLSYNLTSDNLWPWFMTFDHMNIWRFPYYINKPSLIPIRLQLFKLVRPFSHFQPFGHGVLTALLKKCTFGSNWTSTFQIRWCYILSPSYNLTSDDLWPWYITFGHMNIWRFPWYINKPSLVRIRLQLFK